MERYSYLQDGIRWIASLDRRASVARVDLSCWQHGSVNRLNVHMVVLSGFLAKMRAVKCYISVPATGEYHEYFSHQVTIWPWFKANGTILG